MERVFIKNANGSLTEVELVAYGERKTVLVRLSDGSTISLKRSDIRRQRARTARPTTSHDYSQPLNCLPGRRTWAANESLESFFSRRVATKRYYPEDMLREDGTPNWEAKELWDYERDADADGAHFWLTYAVLHRNLNTEKTYQELEDEVVALAGEKGTVVHAPLILKQMRGIIRGEPSCAPPGFGKIVSRGPAPGYLKLEYDPQVALAEWNKFRRHSSSPSVSTSQSGVDQ